MKSLSAVNFWHDFKHTEEFEHKFEFKAYV